MNWAMAYFHPEAMYFDHSDPARGCAGQSASYTRRIELMDVAAGRRGLSGAGPSMRSVAEPLWA
jgi:hypothetical protein